MMLLFLVLLYLCHFGLGTRFLGMGVCEETSLIPIHNLSSCIQEVKLMAADSDLFWFGQRWKYMCKKIRKNKNWIDCYNPPTLKEYNSIGARIFRVRTFDQIYFRNLEIFPQMNFTSPQGSYFGCDHEEKKAAKLITNIQPKMEPIEPWYFRMKPNITWRGMYKNTHKFYTLVIMDPGFGQLQYLAYNFPHNTTEAYAYRGPLNFRSAVNPSVLLVLEQPNGVMPGLHWTSAMEENDLVNLPRFIVLNGFQQRLVGLNWFLTSTDAYAIEKQRQANIVDNCPLLLRQKMFSIMRQNRLRFVPRKSLLNLDSWISAKFHSKATDFNVCCEHFHYRSKSVPLDAIADHEVSPVYAREPPVIQFVNAFRSKIYEYKRTSRDQIALLNQNLYSLILFDASPSRPELGSGSKPFVHWLVINIPARTIQEYSKRIAGDTVISYRGPVPIEGEHRYFLLLFQQEDHITSYNPVNFSPEQCSLSYKGRCQFNLRSWMARYSLTLKAANWFRSHVDPFALFTKVRWGFLESQLCSGSETFSPGCKNQKLLPVAVVQRVNSGRRLLVWPLSWFIFYTMVLLLM